MIRRIFIINSNENFVGSDEAKGIWKSGSLRVLGILIIDKDGDKIIIN